MWYNHDHELLVLVNGKPITEYSHEGQTLVEGRKGSDYELKLRNRTSTRALYVVSVDGLDVVDGKQAGIDSRGYVIEPWSEITISGWKLDAQTAAKFEFRPQERSYSNNMGHGTDNTGVIGVMVFNEKPKPVWHPPSQWIVKGGSLGPAERYSERRMLRSSTVAAGASSTPHSWGSGLGGSFDPAYTFTSNSVMAGSLEAQSMANTASSEPASMAACADAVEDSGLGTGFGAAMQFHTMTVEFERADPKTPNATLVLYYDSRKGLERRGIVFTKSHVKPNPFPADKGCSPPAGWRG